MSDWATSNEQWTAWTREALAMPPRHDGFGLVDEQLCERLAQGGFLGGLEETTVTGSAAEAMAADEETKVRAAPKAPAATAFDLEDEADDGDEVSPQGQPHASEPEAEAAETMIRGVVPTGELEVGLTSPEGGLEVGLATGPTGAEFDETTPPTGSAVTQPEGLFIPSLTRPAEPPVAAEPQPPPTPAAAPPPRSGGTVVALNPLHEAAAPPAAPGQTLVPGAVSTPPEPPPTPLQPEPAVTGSTLPPGMVQADAAPPAVDPPAVSGDTLPPPADAPRSSGGQIVMGGGSAEESMTAGVIGGGNDSVERAPAPTRQKVVIGAPVPAPAREDVTAEIDATDIFDDDDEADEVGAPAVGPAPAEAPGDDVVEEVGEDVVEEVVEEVEELGDDGAQQPTPAGPGFDPHDIETTQRLPASVEPPAPPKPPPAPARPEAAAPAPVAAQPAAPEVAPRGPDSGAQPSAPRQPGWPEEVFTESYAALTRDNHPSSAKGEVEFFVKSTNLQPGARVLDVGCGDGAHAIVLSQQGYDVTAVDLSPAQLARAEHARAALGVTAQFVRGDMRDLPVQGTFSAILCIGSTFGYYDDEENRAVLRRLASLLAPGGRLLLQVFNRDHMISRLPARSWWQGRGCLVLDEAQMNYFNNRLAVHRTAVFEDGRQFEHNIQIRTYNAHELGRMCVDAGLRVVQISGSRLTPGRFYGASSADIWLTVEPKT